MPLDATYLRSRFLQGFALEDATGKPFPEAHIEHAIDVAKAWFQRKYGTLFERTHVLIGEVPEAEIPKPKPGYPALPRIARHGMDYEPDSWQGDKWASLKLPWGPIKDAGDLYYVGLGLGGRAMPAIISFPDDWIQLSERRYYLRLYPGYNSLAVSHVTGFHLSIVASHRRVPNAWRIAYTAGFEDVLVEEPDLAYAIGLRATIDLLPSIAMLDEGALTSESISVDGLSQARNYAVSGQTHRLSPYESSLQKHLDDFLKSYYQTRSGPRFFSA